jgi:hypothetical protein
MEKNCKNHHHNPKKRNNKVLLTLATFIAAVLGFIIGQAIA